MVWYRVIWSAYVPVVGSYEHGNEPLGSGKVGGCTGQLNTTTSKRRTLLHRVHCGLKEKCLYQKSERYRTAAKLNVSMKHRANWHFHGVCYSTAFEG
jgi:hypothetical protein